MSEKNKETLLNGNAAILRGDHESFLAVCTEDTTWNFLGDTVLKGKDEVRQWMKKTYLQPPVVKVDNLIADGDFLTAVGEVTMFDKDGKPTTYYYSDVWQFRDGLLADLRAFVIEQK